MTRSYLGTCQIGLLLHSFPLYEISLLSIPTSLLTSFISASARTLTSAHTYGLYLMWASLGRVFAFGLGQFFERLGIFDLRRFEV